jgi:thioredoxin reductase
MELATEIAVVGGGPAGLSAALVLARARRSVVVFDGGHHRNDGSSAVHGFLTRDGIAPSELRAIARSELKKYGTVRVVRSIVNEIAREPGDAIRFRIITAAGETWIARRILIATGIVDTHPPIAGAEALHGRLVLPCPYCDGWERRDRSLGAYGHPDDRGARYALLLAQWSRDVTFYGGGPAEISDELRAMLAAHSIAVEERTVERCAEDKGGIRLELADGTIRRHAALFYHLGCLHGHDLARRLGIPLDEHGGITVDKHAATPLAGVYAAGDATRDTLQAIVGAGEGAVAAIAMNQSLVDEDIKAASRSAPRRSP